jgi:hypothetical protein
MKLYFDHVLGKQRSEDFVFTLISATFEAPEWDYAFENGWAPIETWFDSNFSDSNDLIWYQTRQSRISVEYYKPSDKTKKLVKNTIVKYKISKELLCPLDDIYIVYLKYCEYKKFGDLISKETFNTYFNRNNNYYIYFYIGDILVAFTKLSLWGRSLLTEIFWWDYENPELSIGKLSSYLELEIAKTIKVPYVYTGISYGLDSIYKSNKKGFQFWTGRTWSSDVNLFKFLCAKDDSLTTIEDLHDYQYEYLKLLKV